MSLGLVAALELGRPPGLVAIVGGGGKTSLLFALAELLPGRVVLSTTTRIFAAQMERAAAVCSTEEAGWQAHLDRLDASLLVVGGVEGERALGVAPELPGRWLARSNVDWVVVEADGSRMRPVKAPAEHEPVIPEATHLVVCVAGIDALDGPIEQVAHRPERVAAITGLAPRDRLTPAALGALLASPDGGAKRVPPGARLALLLNKVESPEQRERAEEVAARALEAPHVDHVVIGALQGDLRSGWEVRRRA